MFSRVLRGSIFLLDLSNLSQSQTPLGRTSVSMFALAPSQIVVRCPRAASTPKRARVAVAATQKTAVEVKSKTSNKERAISILTSTAFASVLMLSPNLTPAAFADPGACFKSCESECLKLAPGSGEYCSSACSDECAAMKEENGGEDVDSGAFGQRQEKGDFENLLEKMLDSQKIFFVGPSSEMKKAPKAE